MRKFVFGKIASLQGATLMINNTFTNILERFYLLFKNIYSKNNFHWLLLCIGRVDSIKEFLKLDRFH